MPRPMPTLHGTNLLAAYNADGDLLGVSPRLGSAEPNGWTLEPARIVYLANVPRALASSLLEDGARGRSGAELVARYVALEVWPARAA